MKCGKKTEDDQIFCSHCLGVMEQYPVKPDVHIQLPNRRVAPAQKKTGRKRRNLSADEQVAFLRSRLRLQGAVMILLILALLISLGMLFMSVTGQNQQESDPNYSQSAQ